MLESDMFSVKVNGEMYGQSTENLQFELTVFKRQDNTRVWGQHFKIENWSKVSLEIQDVISLSIPITNEMMLHYFESAWGREFVPKQTEISTAFELKSELGRSSAQFQSLFYLESDAEIRLFQLGWSGNWRAWVADFDGELRLNVGLEQTFKTILKPGEVFESFPVYVAVASDLNEAGNLLSAYGERHVFPKNPLEDVPVVSWNHWWAYEDKNINEEVFLATLERASVLGINAMILDAGWFGAPNDDWFKKRGDWEFVNKERFPAGLRFLSDAVHAKGMKFGLWCEFEALGEQANLRLREPHFAATFENEGLGYICFGNKEAQSWAFETLSHLISTYNCDWIKLDFNLDPKHGCNSTVHDHGEWDGLYAHYKGLYQVLYDLRQKFPHVVIENCASGGLRTDWGMLKETHLQFLSDPDHAPHQLQVFWSASLSIPPLRCYHFTSSDTLDYLPFPRQKWQTCNEAEIRAFLRVGGLHRFGLSHPLIEWDQRTMEIVAEGIAEYQEKIFPRLKDAKVYRLCSQPDREKPGVDVFQFVASDEAMMVFVFDFSEESPCDFKMDQPLVGIDEASIYECEWLTAKKNEVLTGEQLLLENWCQPEGINKSEVIMITKR